MNAQSDTKLYGCKFCDSKFSRKRYLQAHLRTHTGEKPFQCDVCSKRFTEKSSLNTHKKSHSGEQPFVCEICDKRFTVKNYLTAHQRIHKEKILNCKQCSITFTSKDQYFMHLQTHKDKITYNCNICNRAFARESNLTRHQKNQTCKTKGGSRLGQPSSGSVRVGESPVREVRYGTTSDTLGLAKLSIVAEEIAKLSKESSLIQPVPGANTN